MDLFQGFGFDLTNTLTSDIELFSNLFECVSNTVCKSETHLKNLLFTWVQIFDDFLHVIFQELKGGCTVWRDVLHVLNEVFKGGVFFVITDWCFKRDGIL